MEEKLANITTPRLTLLPLSRELLAMAARTGEVGPLLGYPCEKLTWEQRLLHRRIYAAKCQLSSFHPNILLLCTAWQLIDRTSKQLVGEAGFKGPPEWGELEIGYSTRASHRNRGYMTEAVEALCRFAFEQKISLPECIIATTKPDNIASQRVLIKNGFHQEGRRGSLLAWMLVRPKQPPAAPRRPLL